MPSRSPCGLLAPGHAVQPITYWRSMSASDRRAVASIEVEGPDTLVIVLSEGIGPALLTHPQDGPTTLRYCNHDVAAVLADFAQYGPEGSFFFHVPGLAFEVFAEEGLRRHSLADPYRYQPCTELTRDPHAPFNALTIPRIPELDQIRRDVRTAKPGLDRWPEPPRSDDELDEEEWEEDESEEDEDLDDDEDEEWDEDDDADEDFEHEDDELVGDVIAKVRIASHGWFDGTTSELVELSPTELGTRERWTSADPGEVRTWTIAEGERAAAAARWVVEELDRVLEGFSAAEHLLRLIVDGTVGDGFVLAGGFPVDEEDGDAEETDEDQYPDAYVDAWGDVEYFPVRVTLVDGVAGVDPAPEHLAEPADGIRADQRWCVHSGGVTHLLDPDVRGGE